MRTLLLISMAVLLLACGTETSEQEDETSTALIAPPPYMPGVVLIEREIIFSDAIIRGTLNTVKVSVISDAEGKYWPSVKFNFTVLETLKGTYTGGTIYGIWIGEYRYDTRDEAVARSIRHIAERDTQWDNREAILLLYKRQYPDLDGRALDNPSHHILAKVLERGGPADDHYSLYSEYHRSWLPLANTAGQGNDKEFLLAPPGPTDALAHPNGSTITLGGMKQLIADMTAEYDGGDGSDVYRECLDRKYQYMQRVRNWPITRGIPYTHWKADPTIESGQPANTTVDSVTLSVGAGYQVGDTIPVSPVISFVGTGADLFDKSTTPVRSSLEYDDLLQTARPLPAGTYEFAMETRPVAYAICNHFYRDEYTVTVTAPEGTLHELFFDPVSAAQSWSGEAAVAADATNGVLKPATFTDANGASAIIQRIAWESGTVEMTLIPHTGLADHVLDFIALDGSVILSLDAADATVDAATNTLSWPMPHRPWKDGDKLMLRIHDGPVTPVPTPIPTPAPTQSGPSAPEPAPIMHAVINPATLYPESLDQMIMRTDFIVRATLVSATATTEAVSSREGASTIYRPVHRLRFTVHEYLKGSGSSEILVVVRPILPRDMHQAQVDARREADRLLSQRNTTWDNRQAVLFLIRETRDWYSSLYNLSDEAPGSGESQSVDTFVLPLIESEFRPVWAYSIDTLSRVWLPSSSVEAPDDIDTMELITDGAKIPHPVISLADFRTKKEALEATLKAGEGIEGYAACISGKLFLEQHRRANPDWPTPTDEKTLGSGLASGAEIFREREGRNSDATDYHNYWLSGADMDLFRAVRIDDDSDPKDGYEDALETARPLPAGVYNVRHNQQHYTRIPCNYKPDDAYVAWTVTVTAPDGVLHELFFDPVTATQAQNGSAAVAADGTNGVLKPATFTDANGASATIQGISWVDGAVEMRVVPHGGLAGHVLDFIGLDGKVTLSLEVDGASVDAARNTLRWPVDSQPWEEGDKLMVRIREGSP